MAHSRVVFHILWPNSTGYFSWPHKTKFAKFITIITWLCSWASQGHHTMMDNQGRHPMYLPVTYLHMKNAALPFVSHQNMLIESIYKIIVLIPSLKSTRNW